MYKKVISVMLAIVLAVTPASASLAEEIIAENESICDDAAEIRTADTPEPMAGEVPDGGLIVDDGAADDSSAVNDGAEIWEDGAVIDGSLTADDGAADDSPAVNDGAETWEDGAVIDDSLILDIEEVTLERDLAVDDTVIADEVRTAELSESGLASDACAPLFRTYSARTAYVDSYGGQLDGDASVLYSTLVNAYMTERGCDKLAYTLSEPLTFSVPDGVVVQENGTNKMKWNSENNTEYQAVLKELQYIVQASFDAVIYDYPEIFWMSAPKFSWSISFWGQAGSYTGMISAVNWIPTEKYTGASSQIAAFDAAVKNTYEQLNASLDGDVSSYNKVKVIHDYLCDNIVYEENALAHTAAGVFLQDDKRVVCEGYAKAFMILCREFGLESVLIPGGAKTSKGVEGHMWNYVRMEDGKWYLIDATWDDQQTYISDKYFLAGNQSVGFRGITLYEERESNKYSKFSQSENTFQFSFPVLSECKYHTEHTWGDIEQTAATCTSDAKESAACTVAGCDAARETVHEGTALGHDYAEEYTIDQEAKCETAGQKSRHCSRCDAVTDAEEIPALGHDYAEEYTIDREAKCETAGQKSRHCSRCDAVTDVEAIPAPGHKWDAGKVTKAPTCTEAGVTTYTCSQCGDTRAEAIPALGHDYAEEYTIDQEAKCETVGQKSRHCSRCDTVTDAEAIPALGHKWDAGKVTKASTCTEAGVTTYTCSQCGNTKTEAIPALGHKWDAGKVTIEPTCTEAGEKVYTCARCKGTQTETVRELGHDFAQEFTIDQEATCDLTGSESRHCRRCSAVTDSNVIPAHGHKYGEYTVMSEPTALAEGHEVHSCQVCGDMQNRITPRLRAKLSLNVTSLKLKAGQSTTAVKVSGLAKGDSVVSWRSSKPRTVKVTKTGKITGKKVGTAVVTVTLASGKTAEIRVKVQKTDVRTTKISGLPKKITMEKGQKMKLRPVVSPITSRQKVKYRSSNKKIVTVNGKGVITAKKAGKAKITVQSGSKKATVTVIVSRG